jgi:hypothetical protein
MIYRNGGLAATSFNTKKNLTNTGVSDNNKWWKVFEYSLATNYTGDSFKLQMNEYNAGSGVGKSIVFNILVKRQDPSTVVNVNVESGLSSFDLANFEVLYNSTTKKLSFYYKVTTTYTVTNWLVLNARATTTSDIVWSNTLIGTTLSGQTSDTITSKTIALNKVNGVFTLPTIPPAVGQVLGYGVGGTTEWVTPADNQANTVLFADLATTEALNACTYYNGIANDGVGATLTGNVNGQLATISNPTKIDNVVTSLNQVILVWNQVNQIQNGLYRVAQLGSVSQPFILVRAEDADQQSELYPIQVNIFFGAIYSNRAFLQKTVDPVVGVSNIVFAGSQIGISTAPIIYLDTVTSSPLPTCTYASGTNAQIPGFNASLTADVNGALGTINGIALVANMRILVKDQVNQAHNGDYIVNSIGGTTSKWKLYRLSAWGGEFLKAVREWKVNNSGSTKFGARYSTNLATLSNLNVGITSLIFNELFFSGTNTGDQIISDATISITDITTNNFDTTKHGFVPKGTNVGNFLKDDGTWGVVDTAIPQTNIIYVDSVNGVDAISGRGDVNEPYLTPEYALSNVTNAGTFTANTATNTTLSAISDVNNALLEIGMYVSGSGIPFGTIIVAKGNQGGNANTVTLSKSTTATATGVTLTWVKTYNVILSGSFIVTSSLFKEGMYINPQSAEISWGDFTLFNINTYVNKIPYYILGQGNYFGTSVSSVFILTNNTQVQGCTLSITFGNIETIGTSYVFSLTSGSNENYINIVGDFVNARFGRVCLIDGGTSTLSFDSYGLLGGLAFGFIGGKKIDGNHTTPASITVLSSGYGTQSLANLTGSTAWTGQSSHRGYINGTTHNIVGSLVDFYSTGGGGTITASGNSNTITAVTSYTLNVSAGACSVYGSANYILSAISGSLYFYGQADASTISGSGLINNYGYIYVISMGSFTGTFNNYGTVVAGSFGGGGNVNNYGSVQMIYYGIGVAANKRFVNRGYIFSAGSLLNSNAIITLANATGVFENYGTIENTNSDITKALIEKTAGILYLRQGSYLKVANGKSPIKCTANTSASKDVYYFGVTDNCDGTTYGLSIAFDGSSFAPNDLVGGTLYENVNY